MRRSDHRRHGRLPRGTPRCRAGPRLPDRQRARSRTGRQRRRRWNRRSRNSLPGRLRPGLVRRRRHDHGRRVTVAMAKPPPPQRSLPRWDHGVGHRSRASRTSVSRWHPRSRQRQRERQLETANRCPNFLLTLSPTMTWLGGLGAGGGCPSAAPRGCHGALTGRASWGAGSGRIARSDQIELLALGGVDANRGCHRNAPSGVSTRSASVVTRRADVDDCPIPSCSGMVGGQRPVEVGTVGDLTAAARWLWPRS
jgi:hypothetical protein